MKEVIDCYNFIEISKSNESEINNAISSNMNESKVIIINHYKEKEVEDDDLYFVLSFKRTILVINQSNMKILQTVLSKKEKLEICFLSDTKEFFDDINNKFDELKIKYSETTKEENFEDDINRINLQFFNQISKDFPNNSILKIIKSSLSGYLIKQSYFIDDRINSFNDKINDSIKPREIAEDEIIELRTIGTGSVFQAVLGYHIEYEKLIVIKKFNSYDSENKKLLVRETQNYGKINHPFIPKYYGTIKYDDISYPVIEFINGNTLLNTDISHLSETEIYEIIFQMFLVFNYLHNNHFIYRDLKPNNIMIDQNKMFVLIDFDRMVKIENITDESIITKDLSDLYAAPEVNLGDISNKCDIYSIGKIIEIFKSVIQNYEDTILFQMYKKCINIGKLRPDSSELMNDFIPFIKEYIKINKFINYLLLASDQKIPQALFFLGVVYEDNQYISQDINKSIHYFSLAADQNIPQAQYNLGFFYYEGKYVPRDINKSIHYFSLAADQNIPQAQYNLGQIFYNDRHVSQDINKSIFYFTNAANHNHIKAQTF